MPKYTPDPELNSMANEARHIIWHDPLSPEELDDAQEMLTGRAPRMNVHPLPNLVDWAIRYYIGGMQRTFGIARKSDLPNLLRFADMVKQHFWKYRVRGCTPPAARDINYSPDRLEADYASEDNALALLKRMEQYLLDSGAIKSSATRRQELKTKRATRPNFRNELRADVMEISERMEGFGITLDQFGKQLGEMQRILIDLRDKQNEPRPRTVPLVVTGPVTMPVQIPDGTVYTGDPIPRQGYQTGDPIPRQGYQTGDPIPRQGYQTGDPLPQNPITVCWKDSV